MNEKSAPITPDYESRITDARVPEMAQPSVAVKISCILLLLVGVELWLNFSNLYGLTIQLKLLVAIALLALIPPVNRLVAGLLDRIRNPSAKAARLTALAIAVLAALYLYGSAIYVQRVFPMHVHDEFSYMLQIHMLAHGKLAMPALPLPDFFDTFWILTKPVYASIYFPGTALAYLPALWLHVPAWFMPLVYSGGCAGLLYLVITDLVDGMYGLISVLMLLPLRIFRWLSIRLMAPIPLMALELLTMLAYLRWRRKHNWRWALAVGCFAGWGAITRPVDALAFAIPIGLAMLFDLRHHAKKQWLITGGCVVLAAAPFLALQVAANRTITGQWFTTPHRFYHDRDMPGTGFGFHPYDSTARPQSVIFQKQEFYMRLAKPTLEGHKIGTLVPDWLFGKLPVLFFETLPHPFFIALMPLALLGLGEPRRLAVAGIFPAFIGLFIFFVFFLAHYLIVVILPVAFGALLGAKMLEQSFPRRRELTTFLALAICMLCISAMPEFNRYANDELHPPVFFRTFNQRMAALPHQPAVVLFRFHPNQNIDDEPVYNSEVIWPDDSPVVKAHDLGPRNIEVYRYYAGQPDNRYFYLFDEKDGAIYYLGRARDLANGEAPTSQPVAAP